MSSRIIAHLDMDAFFAAVEERDNPQFAGMPIVVGSDPKEGNGRGVVSTANYAARAYGIFSATPISKAWQYSQEATAKGLPPAIFLSGNYRHYTDISKLIRQMILGKFSTIEQASVDEFYIDLSEYADFNHAKELMHQLKEAIRIHHRLTCSIGIGPNKLIAKIASSTKKPDGLTMVTDNDVLSFLHPMSVSVIPGVGPKMQESLLKKNIKTIADLCLVPEDTLVAWYGKWGAALYRKARGKSDSVVSEEREIKSISEQETLYEDSLSPTVLIEMLDALSEHVIERMHEEQVLLYKTIALTVRFSDFTTKNRSHTLPSHTDSSEILKREIHKLFLPFLDKRENPGKQAIRLLGVKIEKFTFEIPAQEKASPVILQQTLFS